jgi:hypothetical protein
LIAVALLMSPTLLAGQASATPPKDPAVALGFAWLCPGCGHLYSGETTKGTVIAAVALGSLAGGLAVQLSRSSRVDGALACRSTGPWSDCGEVSTDLTPILVGGAIGIAAWAYGLIDAPASADRANARHGLRIRGLDLGPTSGPDGALGVRLSLPLPSGKGW